MVSRTPPKRTAKVAPLPLNPQMLRETVKKVDRCMARLQELQYVVTGGNKVVSGVSLSPRSTRSYLKTSVRCKQESFRNGNGGLRTISPTGKFEGGWKRMSLPAMLVGEIVGEIIQDSQFAREIVKSVSYITQAGAADPKTPISTKQRRHNRLQGLEHTQLKSRRKREKQNVSQSFRSERCSPKLQRARSRINFKVSPEKRNDIEIEKDKGNESTRHSADRISPRHKPWAKKTVLFPNPLFTSTSPTRQLPQRFCRTRSPVIARNKQLTPHKFLIKSPASASTAKFQVKVKKSPPRTISPTKTFTKKSPPRKKTSQSPTRTGTATSCTKKSPTARSRSPARLACCIKTLSPPLRLGVTIGKKSPKMSTASKLRRSLSPARLASRLMSPLKSRKPVRTSIDDDGLTTMPASKRRSTTPMRFLIPRI